MAYQIPISHRTPVDPDPTEWKQASLCSVQVTVRITHKPVPVWKCPAIYCSVPDAHSMAVSLAQEKYNQLIKVGITPMTLNESDSMVDIGWREYVNSDSVGILWRVTVEQLPGYQRRETSAANKPTRSTTATKVSKEQFSSAKAISEMKDRHVTEQLSSKNTLPKGWQKPTIGDRNAAIERNVPQSRSREIPALRVHARHSALENGSPQPRQPPLKRATSASGLSIMNRNVGDHYDLFHLHNSQFGPLFGPGSGYIYNPKQPIFTPPKARLDGKDATHGQENDNIARKAQTSSNPYNAQSQSTPKQMVEESPGPLGHKHTRSRKRLFDRGIQKPADIISSTERRVPKVIPKDSFGRSLQSLAPNEGN